MSIPPWTAHVLLACALLQIFLMGNVGLQRRRSGIHAPAMTGDAGLERAVRIQMNTLEQFGIFLPALLVAGAYANDGLTGALGGVWLLGRVLYAIGYQQSAARRSLGFLIASVATIVLWLVAARELLRVWMAVA